jgi:hypothetical protein
MTEQSASATAVSLLQPPLSGVLAHLQPNTQDCVYGVDLVTTGLVHVQLGQATPLLILGDPAMGTVDLASSLLVQLYAMNDPSHLQVVLLDRTGQLASLVQFLPQTREVATTESDIRHVLDQVKLRAGSARQAGTGSPLVLVVVNEFRDLRSDASAWSAFRTLAEHGHEWGVALIALSQSGDHEITPLCRQRIVFAPEQTSPASGREFIGEQAFQPVHAARQRGQFLIEGADRQGTKQLVLPLIDILALHLDGQHGVRFLQKSPLPIACAGSEVLLHIGREREPVECLKLLAAHVRVCLRCRHGLLPLATPLPGMTSLSCGACCSLLPAYYEATHPEHPQVTMQPAELAQVAWHLGQCQACCEIWGALVQFSVLEEEGEPRGK